MAQSYTNVGGTGNRTTIVTITTTATLGAGSIPQLINGTQVNSLWFTNAQSGREVRFDFGTPRLITEATWYQDVVATHGTWQWQGSPDASAWTNIGATFTLGSPATQAITTLSGNATSYRYYRMLQTAGTTTSGPFLREVEFSIDDAVLPAPAPDQSGTNTSNNGTTVTISVTSAANRVVVVGAVVGSTSTTTNPTLSVSGAGLTWTAAPAGAGAGNVGRRIAVQLFWAYTASAFTSQTVTVTSSQTIDTAGLVYETFSGANAARPVDPNALSSFGLFGVTTTGTVTTTNPSDTTLVLVGSNYNTGPAVAVGTGTRDLSTTGINGLFAYTALGRWAYAAPQTGATVGFTGVANSGLSAITLTGDPLAVTQQQARAWIMA